MRSPEEAVLRFVSCVDGRQWNGGIFALGWLDDEEERG